MRQATQLTTARNTANTRIGAQREEQLDVNGLDGAVLAVRALSFAAALQAAGVPLFLTLFGRAVPQAREALRALAYRSAWAALGLVALYQVSEPIRLLASLRALLDAPLQVELLESALGTTTFVRAFGLVLLIAGCRRSNQMGVSVAVLGSAFVVVSFAFMGHTVEEEHRWLTTVALLSHVLIVAFWFGSLLPLYLASRRESLVANGELIEHFSYVAVRMVPAIFIAGLALAAVLVPSLASLRSDYGVLLLTKVAGFAVLMALATYNKARLGPLVRQGRANALAAFRVVVVVEWTLIAAVIAVTATMTGLFSPTH